MQSEGQPARIVKAMVVAPPPTSHHRSVTPSIQILAKSYLQLKQTEPPALEAGGQDAPQAQPRRPTNIECRPAVDEGSSRIRDFAN
jgi:hypothetical protein